MKLIENMIVAFSMYSRIPMPRLEWNRDNMRYTLCFFPLVGIVCGICVFLWGALSVFLPVGNILRTAVFLLIPLLITGGIHLDGLLDTADALSSWQTKEKRLEILKDSHAGAFAVIVCAGYFTAAFGIWSEIGVQDLGILGAGFILSRALSGFGITAFRCAKSSGLVASFADSADRYRCRAVLLVEAFAATAVMILIHPGAGVLTAAGAWITFWICRCLSYSRFGGITGDTQGFFLQVCELVMAFATVTGDRIWF